MQLKRIMILVMAALAGGCSGNVDPDDSKTEGPLAESRCCNRLCILINYSGCYLSRWSSF